MVHVSEVSAHRQLAGLLPCLGRMPSHAVRLPGVMACSEGRGSIQEEAKKSTHYKGTPSQDLFPTSRVPFQGSHH